MQLSTVCGRLIYTVIYMSKPLLTQANPNPRLPPLPICVECSCMGYAALPTYTRLLNIHALRVAAHETRHNALVQRNAVVLRHNCYVYLNRGSKKATAVTCVNQFSDGLGTGSPFHSPSNSLTLTTCGM